MTEPPRDYSPPRPEETMQAQIDAIEAEFRADMRKLLRVASIGIVCVLCLLYVVSAFAHDAPAGWQYPYACCSGIDCRPISQASISELADGYHIAQNGEVLGYTDARIRESRDGDFHLCTVAGEEKSRTICLFVPPRGF